jgi:RNA polymerase sigma-70 factor, ECF subfamily
VFALRHIDGERLENIAVLCNCSLATVKRRLTAAIAKLDKAMADAK